LITKLAIGLLIIGIAIAGGCLSEPGDLVGKTDAFNAAWKVFCNHTNVTLFNTIKLLDGTHQYIVKNDMLEKTQEFGDWEAPTCRVGGGLTTSVPSSNRTYGFPVYGSPLALPHCKE
jgi:hypothetical protein